LVDGQIVSATITSINADVIQAEVEFGHTIYLNYAKEARFFRKHGSEPEMGMAVDVMITDAPNCAGSAELAFMSNFKNELHKSIREAQTAYRAKIVGTNSESDPENSAPVEAVCVALHTTQYRGDHSAEVVLYYKLYPSESVVDLMKRINVKSPDYVTLHVFEGINFP